MNGSLEGPARRRREGGRRISFDAQRLEWDLMQVFLVPEWMEEKRDALTLDGERRVMGIHECVWLAPWLAWLLTGLLPRLYILLVLSTPSMYSNKLDSPCPDKSIDWCFSRVLEGEIILEASIGGERGSAAWEIDRLDTQY